MKTTKDYEIDTLDLDYSTLKSVREKLDYIQSLVGEELTAEFHADKSKRETFVFTQEMCDTGVFRECSHNYSDGTYIAFIVQRPLTENELVKDTHRETFERLSVKFAPKS